MTHIVRTPARLCFALLSLSGVCLPVFSLPAAAQDRDSLIITNEPLPPGLRENVYSTPAKVREIRANDLRVSRQPGGGNTVVSEKIRTLKSDLSTLQAEIAALAGNLSGLERENAAIATEYYANVATINAQLQAGSTPGNPRLEAKIGQAEKDLATLADNVGAMNRLATEASNAASDAAFLLESVRATYSISGALEEDHAALAELEDIINNTLVVIERVLNNVSDNVTRTSAYLSSERNNLRTLSLAVANGDLYGKSLSNRPFSSAKIYEAPAVEPAAPAPGALSGPRPLAKIRFDRPDVAYEQPVYLAVNEALTRYPNARLDLVAVTPTKGNAAQVAIESTRARRNAERVLRTLTQMGLPLEQVDLSYRESEEAETNEVHIYIR